MILPVNWAWMAPAEPEKKAKALSIRLDEVFSNPMYILDGNRCIFGSGCRKKVRRKAGRRVMRNQRRMLPRLRMQRSESGQALVELAIVLPIVIALLCGIVEFGWMCFNQINIANLAREAAREGIVYSAGNTDLNALSSEMVENAPAGMRDKLTVDIRFSNLSNPREGDVIVDIAYRASAITPLLGILTESNEYELNASCTMKVE
jgi:hypothetical protein